MADDSELDYLITFIDECLLEGRYINTDTIASVNTTTKAITLTAIGGTLNQYAGNTIIVTEGDNIGDELTIVSNTNATPTVLTVSETITADLATDVIKWYDLRLIVKSFETTRNIGFISGNKKCLIFPGEIYRTDHYFYRKRYRVQLSLDNEANTMIVINDIIDGTIKYNKRASGFTNVPTMCNVKLVYTGKSWVSRNSRWNIELWIDVEWSTS